MSNDIIKIGSKVMLKKLSKIDTNKDLYTNDFHLEDYVNVVGVVEAVDSFFGGGWVKFESDDDEEWMVHIEDLDLVFEHKGIIETFPQDVQEVYYFDDLEDGEDICGYKGDFSWIYQDGEWLALCDYDGKIKKYVLENGELLFSINDKSIAISSDKTNVNLLSEVMYNPLIPQEGGDHYKTRPIQPIEFSERNGLSMCQGNIVKYITRHKEKHGVEDLSKVVHYCLLEAFFVYGDQGSTELRNKILKLLG